MSVRPMLPVSLLLAATAAAAGPVDFNREIRPLFARHCTACHGGVKEAGGISFVYRDKAMAAGDSGNAAIVPGDPSASELVRRIKATDPDDVMPKPEHGPPLPAEEIAMIERWIAEGAEWQEHWAFEAPVDAGLPEISAPDWPTAPLDHHVLARLEAEGLAPSPEAPPEEWLRRVSFDLTGLPPTPEELAEFQENHAADPVAAREAVVDRLLASPRFGERWAAVWLDMARYSDTYGFEKDPPRDIWPWRDWVIRTFNADMPFDRFTIEQLAGDLLPEPTADQRLATAFHRNTQTNTEGGTDDEEFRVAAVIDRVNTTWTVWQGTSFGCVQCHSHPYDPIEHEEYYQFAAFFDQSEDTDLTDDFPKMPVAHDPALREEASRLELRAREIRETLNAGAREVAEKVGDWQPFVPDELAPSHGELALSDGMVTASGTLPVGAVHRVSGPAPPFRALRLRIFPDSDDPKKWPERGAFATGFRVSLVAPDGSSTPVPMREVAADFLTGPHDPRPDGNVGAYPKLEGPRWFVFLTEQESLPAEGARLEVTIEQNAKTEGEQATPLRKFSIEISQAADWVALRDDSARRELREELGRISHRLREIPSTHVPVMVERAPEARRETRLFARGNRLNKEQAVEPGLPKLLAAGTDADDRLAMARWLVGDSNPLTPRVIANRLWAEIFGVGIVETAEDFGSSGAAPSHPALLDHLALRLRDHHGWSVKAYLRELVLSSTYRQMHRVSPELSAKDPLNRLLARGPRNRLTAEMIRDQALAVAGLLSPKMHGPPVFPPQPEGVWNTVYSGLKWVESEGEDRHRRAIYTFSRRTSGYPSFLTFDAPSRDVCAARRFPTNTPLQALVTMNDPAHWEAAQALADRLAGHTEDLRAKLARGVLLVTQRPATPAMLDELLALHADASQALASEPDESAKLAESPERAALVLVANTLLNLDSALTK